MVQTMENEKMTPEQFCYWLQGYFEMSEAEKLDEKQVKILKDHLSLVFKKVTPDYTVTTPAIDWDMPGSGAIIC